MVNKAPAFMWYPKDILASARVQMMSLAEECAYRRLIDFCWLNGSIPADPSRAARLVGKGCSAEIVEIALEMFVADPDNPGQMIHERLEKERAKQKSNSEARRKASAARWNKESEYTDARGKQAKSKADANAMQLDNQMESSSFASSSSKPFSSSNESEKGGGGSNGKPPPAADAGNLVKKRQWSDLTEAEKQMSPEEFVTHLQKNHPKKNVREIGRKLKSYCKTHGKNFALERLKGWVEGEGNNLTEKELREMFSDETLSREELIKLCQECDDKGYIQIGEDIKICRHEKIKAELAK